MSLVLCRPGVVTGGFTPALTLKHGAGIKLDSVWTSYDGVQWTIWRNTEHSNSLNTHMTAEDLRLTSHEEFQDSRGEDSRLAVGRRADERFYTHDCRWSHDQVVSKCRQWLSIRGPAVNTGRPADGRTQEALRAVDRQIRRAADWDILWTLWREKHSSVFTKV